MLLISDTFRYATLTVMLLAILLAYYKGRNAVSENGQSLAWTQVPLIAFLTVSIGPSTVATLIYLGYKLGLFQAAVADDGLRKKLAALDIDHMTPMAALALLAELKNEL